MSWAQQQWTVFDTETTGKDPEEARIVTTCIGTVGGGLDSRFKAWLIDPGVDIPEGATAVHGVTTEQAKTAGQPPQEVLPEILNQLEEAWAKGRPVIGHNVAYDFTVLDRDLRRHGLAPLQIRGPVLDSYVLDRHLDPYRKGKRTLTAACEHYGVRLDAAHDATQDAVAAARIVWMLAKRFPDIADLTLGELYGIQVKSHASRQASFARYLEKQGKDASDVSGEWPLRTRVEAVA